MEPGNACPTCGAIDAEIPGCYEPYVGRRWDCFELWGRNLSAAERSRLIEHERSRPVKASAPSAIEQMASYWDRHIERWSAGERALEGDLAAWWESYTGTGAGAPRLDAFPEPYVGSWRAPALVMLGLNPGPVDEYFQLHGGHFARQFGARTYREWAASDPYGSALWEHENRVNPPQKSGLRPNPYRAQRLAFARRWHQRDDVLGGDLLTIELYPWHSTIINAPIRPPAAILDRFIWRPLSELEVPQVFAFGHAWLDVAAGLAGVEEVARWPPGRGHFASAARGAAVFSLPGSQRLVVVWQQGYSGPPGAGDVERLRMLLDA